MRNEQLAKDDLPPRRSERLRVQLVDEIPHDAPVDWSTTQLSPVSSDNDSPPPQVCPPVNQNLDMPIGEPNVDLQESQEQEEEELASTRDSSCLGYSYDSEQEDNVGSGREDLFWPPELLHSQHSFKNTPYERGRLRREKASQRARAGAFEMGEGERSQIVQSRSRIQGGAWEGVRHAVGQAVDGDRRVVGGARGSLEDVGCSRGQEWLDSDLPAGGGGEQELTYPNGSPSTQRTRSAQSYPGSVTLSPSNLMFNAIVLNIYCDGLAFVCLLKKS